MVPVRVFTAAALALLSAGPSLAFDQREVGPGRLPPIPRDYAATIASWGRFFFADPNALAGASLSAPVLIRDGTGRLLWLVCLEAPNAGPDPRTGGVQRHAFGFAPNNYFTAPEERRQSTLTRDYCDERPLAWRPLHATLRTARRR
ncbi:hypothetical protein [Enterovirga sp.]|uniref:hypothetical protein n=1 Tax=Enterovirga sp. TaxID=2026350 RepID=UPI002B7AEFFD|nr:hypothetical protein [Enterovirga sp.]HMO29277.1 hypothetical protein [Enterovirga sp.]